MQLGGGDLLTVSGAFTVSPSKALRSTVADDPVGELSGALTIWTRDFGLPEFEKLAPVDVIGYEHSDLEVMETGLAPGMRLARPVAVAGSSLAPVHPAVHCARLVAPLAVALALAACGDDAGDRVEGYIERSNEVLREASDDFAAANQAYADFRESRIEGRQAVEQLAEARDDILFARSQLAALDAPPEARGLRESLLVFFDANGRLATETADLAVYLPAAQEALEPLEGAGERLGERLEGDASPQRQQRALGLYADALDRVDEDLEELDPPPVLEPTHDTQVQRLEAASEAARDLRGAIGDQDAKAIARRLERFRELGENDEGEGLLESAAVRSYAMRIDGVEQAVAALEDERARLQESLE